MHHDVGVSWVCARILEILMQGGKKVVCRWQLPKMEVVDAIASCMVMNTGSICEVCSLSTLELLGTSEIPLQGFPPALPTWEGGVATSARKGRAEMLKC